MTGKSVGNVVQVLTSSVKVARVRLLHIKPIGLVPYHSIFYDPAEEEYDVFSLNQIRQTKYNSRIYVPFTAKSLRCKSTGGKWRVIQTSDNARVITWQPRAWFITHQNQYPPVNSVRSRNNAKCLAHSRMRGSLKPKLNKFTVAWYFTGDNEVQDTPQDVRLISQIKWWWKCSYSKQAFAQSPTATVGKRFRDGTEKKHFRHRGRTGRGKIKKSAQAYHQNTRIVEYNYEQSDLWGN